MLTETESKGIKSLLSPPSLWSPSSALSWQSLAGRNWQSKNGFTESQPQYPRAEYRRVGLELGDKWSQTELLVHLKAGCNTHQLSINFGSTVWNLCPQLQATLLRGKEPKHLRSRIPGPIVSFWFFLMWPRKLLWWLWKRIEEDPPYSGMYGQATIWLGPSGIHEVSRASDRRVSFMVKGLGTQSL